MDQTSEEQLEQLEELQKQLEEKEQELEVKNQELAEKEERLKKLEDKDINFKNVRESKKKVEEQKATLEDQLAAMQKRLDDKEAATLGKTKENVLAQLSGGDDDLKAKIEAEYNSYQGEVLTEEEIEHRLNKAFRNIQWEHEQGSKINPVAKYAPSTMGTTALRRDRPNFADTEEGKSLAKQMGLQQAKVEKK